MASHGAIAAVAKVGGETKGVVAGGAEGTKAAALDSLHGHLSRGNEVLHGSARESGWSISALHHHADHVLQVQRPTETRIIDTSLSTKQRAEVHHLASEQTAHNRQSEVLGVEATKHYLANNGFTCIHEFGGGGDREGGAMPDIVCRGPDGRPWVIEAKGTQTGTKLKDMGLDRGSDGAGGRVWENSPEWLQRSGEKTLSAMDARLDKHPNVELQSLRDDYAGLVDNGFDDPRAYGRMVAQSGDNLTALDGSRLQGKIAEYVHDVKPNAIVQIRTDTADV